MEERILTLHPQGKKGVHILKRRYDLVKETILSCIKECGVLSFKDLVICGRQKLSKSLDGKPTCYITTVKLDLEARGIIQRIEGKSPQILHIVEIDHTDIQ
jgi:hypothetical protein